MGFTYRLSELDYGAEEREAVLEVLRSEWLSTGSCTERFEAEFGERVGAKAVATSSGTAALHLALAALGVEEGDEVIVPSYTFIATVNAIAYQRATPIFAEIVGAHDLNLDVDALARLVTERTKGIVVVHVAGYASRLTALVEFARAHGLFVVEDAAHAAGATLDGKALGTFGDVGCFSFYANKNLVTGEGGMLASQSSSLVDRARLLRAHALPRTSLQKACGARESYDVAALGYNYRMSDLEAALGSSQLAKLSAGNARRGELVSHYRQRLSNATGITVPFSDNVTDSSHYIFPVVLGPDVDRDAVARALAERGVQTSVHFPPVHEFSLYARPGIELPRTEAVSRRELTLPLHTRLSEADVASICSMVIEEVSRGTRGA